MRPFPDEFENKKPSMPTQSSTTPRSAIVLICDRLNAAFLGPYGNTWIETPALNHLAAQSLLVEQCLTCSPDLPAAYQSYWSGSKGESLLGQFADGQIATTLLTDAQELMAHPLADGFARHVGIPCSADRNPATDIESTEWATILSTVISELDRESSHGEESEKGQLLWIHARGCEGLWDAPYEMRKAFADEEDPDPPTFVEAPSHELTGEVDPDFLLGIQQAYAAEVGVLDACLGPLVERLSQPELANTLFILTAPRGFPLGSHGVVGKSQTSLHVESLHTPLFVRFPDGQYRAERSQVLWQPADVCALLHRWMLGSKVGEEVLIDDLGGERAATCSGEYWSLRTPAWFATGKRSAAEEEESEVRLYAKPADRFEANNVADLCEEIVIDMRAEHERMANRTKSEDEPPLPDHLREPQE